MKRIKKIATAISLTPRTIDMADKYGEKFGYATMSECIAACIAFAFDKSFPDYVYAKPPTEKEKERQLKDVQLSMTNEEYCTQVIKGKLWGGKCWVRKPNHTDKAYALGDIKVLDAKEELSIWMHKKAMDGTYVDAEGLTGESMQQDFFPGWTEDPRPIMQWYGNSPIYADENGELPVRGEVEEDPIVAMAIAERMKADKE